MIKKTAIYSIQIYQVVFSTTLKHVFGMPMMCRYDTTCSEYTKQQVYKKGPIRGITLGAKRLLSCQPFFHTNKNSTAGGSIS